MVALLWIDCSLGLKDLLGNLALVRGDGHSAGADALAVCHILQCGRGSGSCHVFEALNSSYLGRRDAGELIALGCVDRSGDCFAWQKCLEHLRSEAGALVVDVDTLERERLAIYL